LQRETVSANENALTTLEPAAVLGKSAVAIAATQGAATNGAVISYNAQGGRLSDAVTTTGQLVDVLV